MAEFVKHTSCPDCGSSDARAVYSDGSSYCFSCESATLSDEYKQALKDKSKVRSFRKEAMDVQIKSNKPAITDEENQEIKSKTSSKGNNFRGIRDETTSAFGVRTEFNEEGEVTNRYYPCTQDGQLAGYKIREIPKNFYSKGRTGAECELFGQFKFNRGGKYVMIVEGEEDMLSAYQMLKDYNLSKGSDYETAVVSPTTGANSHKQIAAQYRFFDSFEQIIVCFDSDKAGQDAVQKVIPVLPKGKVKIMQMQYKDPNEYLMAGKQKEFVRAFYESKPYVPVGVLGSSQLYDRILEQTHTPKVPFPPFMQKLNDMLVGGLPLGHIVNIAAGTGLGKCLAKGTLVRMHDMTTKKVEDIKNGDLVMGPDGKSRLVTGVTSGIDEMYEVTQNKGMSYVVNSSHILSFKVSCDYKGWKKSQVVNLDVKDYLKLTKKEKHILKGYKADMGVSSNFELNEDYYIIGLWLADGSRTKPSITIANKDTDLIDFVYNYAKKKSYDVTIYDADIDENCKTYNIIGGFKDVLRKFGVLDNKELTDEMIGKMTVNQRASVLAGFIDGDGYLADNGITMTLSDDILANSVITLARSLGISVTTKVVKKTWQSGEGVYRYISMYGNLHFLPNVLTRKKAGIRKQIKDHSVTGVTVKHIGKGEYYGFELSGSDRLFCLEDFTVTHNSSFINEMVYYWVFNSPHKIGIVSMELDAGQYGEAILGRHLSRKLSLISDEQKKVQFLTSENVKRKAHELFFTEDESDRFYLLDNRDGSIEEIQNTIEELVISCGCRIIVLDPLQDILDGLTIDEQAVFMKWCKGIIKSHNCTLILINHVRKAGSGSGNSAKGESFTEEEIQGSSTIIKSASVNILLSRNKYSEDEIERNTTRVMLSKNRICGLTGPAGEVYYENETNTLWDKDKYFSTATEAPPVE